MNTKYLGRIPVNLSFYELSNGDIIWEITDEWAEGEISKEDFEKVKERMDFDSEWAD